MTSYNMQPKKPPLNRLLKVVEVCDTEQNDIQKGRMVILIYCYGYSHVYHVSLFVF